MKKKKEMQTEKDKNMWTKDEIFRKDIVSNAMYFPSMYKHE